MDTFAAKVLTSAVGLALALAASGADAQEVNLYSSRHYDTDVALYDTFTEQTGIEVNLIEGDADQLIERIKAEGRNSPADVLITVDAGRLWRADQAGHPAAGVLAGAGASAIPAELRHPDGKWFGFSQRLRGIVYAKDRVDPSEITSYEDLADPKWQGRICIRSSTNVYNQSLVASMIEADGIEATEAWAQGAGRQSGAPASGRRHRPDQGGRGRRVRRRGGQSLLFRAPARVRGGRGARDRRQGRDRVPQSGRARGARQHQRRRRGRDRAEQGQRRQVPGVPDDASRPRPTSPRATTSSRWSRESSSTRCSSSGARSRPTRSTRRSSARTTPTRSS